MDESKLNIDLSRAQQARQLIENELLTEAFVKLESDYIAAWRQTPPNDADSRERLWQAVQTVAKVRDHLSAVIEDGKLAQAELKQLVSRPKRFGVI